MKKLLLGSVAIAALALPLAAQAADLAVAPAYKAPIMMPPPAYSWNGCYVGIEGGGGNWGRSHTEVTATGVPFQPDFNLSGGLVGGTVGCNWQFYTNWVAGLEGDWSWTNKKGTAFDGQPAGNPVIPVTVEETWFATARGRVGMSFGPALLYATGGAAFTNVKWTGNLQPPAFAPAFAASDSFTTAGGVVGAGIEYMVWKNLSLKLEYLYADFGHHTVCSATCATPFGPYAAREVFVKDQIVRAGLNYRFDWGGPVVARY
jgi:outer membrane immunogenic protein